MAFTKAFAKEHPGSRYPDWIEVQLSDAEEAVIEADARKEHIRLMRDCLSDAEQIFKDEQLKDYQTNLVQIATSLFDKRASHTVWHKEESARKKFEKEHRS